ncbi:type II toxin-antitoxin system Phd/YefM family antitoxin [Plasticicumulans lactativorans]|uniref:type II toxin-antitoxin system Phd/YefM family antitoxin n=1 Tax=Plasticicumulans lactativorans TaxID=1133106 RepID=UPI003C751F14
MQLNLHEARTRLSELVEAARRGEDIVIARSGTPMARLVPVGEAPRRGIRLGLMKGEITIADDFDAPLPADVLAAFEGIDAP